MSNNYTRLVEQAYQDLFGRPSDAEGLDYWTNDIAKGNITPGQLRGSMINSAVTEYGYMLDPNTGYYVPAGSLSPTPTPTPEPASSYTGLVEQAYQDLFGRPSDTGGLSSWTEKLDNGWITPDQLNNFMIGSASGDDLDYYNSHMGYVTPAPAPSPTSYTRLVEQAYQDLFGRPSDAEGIDYWSNGIAKGNITPGQLRGSMINSAVTEYGYMLDPNTGYYVPAGSLSPTPTPTPTFDFPFDLYPSQNNQSETSSYSGLPTEYQDSLLQALIPQLIQSVEDMPGNIDQYYEDAMNAYQSDLKNTVTNTMPSILNEIFGRNMQESSIAGDVTSNVLSDVVSNLQPQAYQTAMQSAAAKAEMPSLLASIAGLGKYNTSSSSSSGEQSDPGDPYQTALDFLKTMIY